MLPSHDSFCSSTHAVDGRQASREHFLCADVMLPEVQIVRVLSYTIDGSEIKFHRAIR